MRGEPGALVGVSVSEAHRGYPITIHDGELNETYLLGGGS